MQQWKSQPAILQDPEPSRLDARKFAVRPEGASKMTVPFFYVDENGDKCSDPGDHHDFANMEGKSWNLETVPNPRYKPEMTASKGIQTELDQLEAATVVAREEMEQALQQTREMRASTELMKASTEVTNRRAQEKVEELRELQETMARTREELASIVAFASTASASSSSGIRAQPVDGEVCLPTTRSAGVRVCFSSASAGRTVVEDDSAVVVMSRESQTARSDFLSSTVINCMCGTCNRT